MLIGICFDLACLYHFNYSYWHNNVLTLQVLRHTNYIFASFKCKCAGFCKPLKCVQN